MDPGWTLDGPHIDPQMETRWTPGGPEMDTGETHREIPQGLARGIHANHPVDRMIIL